MHKKGNATCIIGMHRCGTSMIAGLLHKCGLDFGPANELMPANSSNTLGYFEHQRIAYQVNDALLARLGGSWKTPPQLEANWENDPALDEIRETAVSIISNFKGKSNWAWKDPRASLLIPFWKKVIAELSYIICVRNPLDVAKSLQQRDGLSISAGSKLWYTYISEALSQTGGCRRKITFYEDFFEAPAVELARLTSFLDLPSLDKKLNIENTIFGKLRHHHSTMEELQKNPEVSIDSIRLYKQLREQQSKTKGLHATESLARSAKKERMTAVKNVKKDNLAQVSVANLANLSPVPTHALIFPKCDKPLVSIVVPTYNRVKLLASCLRSVLQYTEIPYELIIVNDASTDETGELMKKLVNVRVVNNAENLDFLRSANAGADRARGKYILFLNNDVSVRPKWASVLVDTMQRVDNCGAVGTKLISMDGRLQEAGAKIWPDGTVSLIGAGDNPFKPEYSYPRLTDYCSAACLLVKTDLFLKLGKFDQRYVPAYYEDADLCMAIWASGHKVIYQPGVPVFHQHMGSRPHATVTKLLETNRTTFVQKWKKQLSTGNTDKNVFFLLDRYIGKRVAVLSSAKSSDRIESQSANNYDSLIRLAAFGYAISLIPCNGNQPSQAAVQLMQRVGIEVFHGNLFDHTKVLEDRAGQYEMIVFDSATLHPHIKMLVEKLYPNAARCDPSEINRIIHEGTANE